ncbi:hypothetical protein [Zhouia amylolytica]|uniref:hypothetical protein n=1 Tax=Zhouia amylolytica TaxID=376730 RepID=UPI0020CE5352|nr:hypothetical protein [Zhouia amylolytica]MCQ0113139.1 hypothetical protein [Zhouia amylolytica]
MSTRIVGRQIVGNSVIMVKWESGIKKWYRAVSHRNLDSLIGNFRNKRGFKYAYIFQYDRENRLVGNKIYWFNLTTEGY